jgi:hypothetical protein
MKGLKEYIEDKEEIRIEKELNEDATQVIASIFGYSIAGMAAAFGGSLLVLGGIKAVKGLTSIWKKIFHTAKGMFNPNRVLSDMKTDPKIKKITNEVKEVKRKYDDELKQVYLAIGQKDFDRARAEFQLIPKTLQDNPDIIKAVVSDIVRVLEQPPIYITSPGNQCYQTIKKVLNIRIARAAAKATEMAMKEQVGEEE